MLDINEVSKHFGGVRALSEVTMQLKPHTVLGLVGPNGAGKTTLINVITGHLTPDSGSITLGGVQIVGKDVKSIAREGIARTYQHSRLVAEMSVLDNVLTGRHGHYRTGFAGGLGFSRSDERRQRAAAAEALRRVGLAGDERRPVGDLPFGMRRLVEVARALAQDPRVVLFDEPSAGLTPADAAHLGALMRETAADGRGVLLIEHNVALVTEICDEITVLDWGEVIAHGEPTEVWTVPRVRSAYLGEVPDVESGELR